MGLLCCLSSRVRVVPESKQDTDAASAARPAIVAADTNTSAEGSWVEKHSRTAATAAAALDRGLAEILHCSGLSHLDLASSNSSSPLQTQQRLPANLQELQNRVEAACSSAGHTAESMQKIAELFRCWLKHYEQHQQQHQQQQQWASLPTMQVPSADALVSAINLVAYSQVTLDSAGVLQRRYKQYSQLLSTLGLQHCGLAACVQPANKAVLACLQLGRRAAAGEVRVSCVVQRRSAFWDALRQLQQQGIVQPGRQQQIAGVVQLAKLFPRFVDEQLVHHHHQQQQQHGDTTSSSFAVEGGEGHGPRKEFFHLIGENWAKADTGQPALFIHLRGPGTWWFNSTLTCSMQLQAAYWAVGWLLGQALVNRCTVGLQLAPLLFHRLLLQPHDVFKRSLAVLQQHDPEAAQGLLAVLQVPQAQYQQLLHIDGRPGSTTRQQYIDLALQQLLVEDVVWQLEALRDGFCAVLDQQLLLDCCFNGASLASALCGPAADESADFDVRTVFRVVLEDEDAGSGRSSSSSSGNSNTGISHAAAVGSAGPLSSERLVLQCLWQVLAAWGPRQKRAFVKFVTGSGRLPAQGSEQLLISFPFVAYSSVQQVQLLGTLPQSHTCANTLELPNYVEALAATDPQLMQEWQNGRGSCGSSSSSSNGGCLVLRQRCCNVLQDRLLVAITNCNSYGLDEAAEHQPSAAAAAAAAAAGGGAAGGKLALVAAELAFAPQQACSGFCESSGSHSSHDTASKAANTAGLGKQQQGIAGQGHQGATPAIVQPVLAVAASPSAMDVSSFKQHTLLDSQASHLTGWLPSTSDNCSAQSEGALQNIAERLQQQRQQQQLVCTHNQQQQQQHKQPERHQHQARAGICGIRPIQAVTLNDADEELMDLIWEERLVL